MKELNILNLFKLNIYQILIFMPCTVAGTMPTVLKITLKRITPIHHTWFGKGKYKQKSFKLNQTKFSILSRCSRLWNKYWGQKRNIFHLSIQYLFKKKTKGRIFLFKNDIDFFCFIFPVNSSGISHQIWYIKGFINKEAMYDKTSFVFCGLPASVYI